MSKGERRMLLRHYHALACAGDTGAMRKLSNLLRRRMVSSRCSLCGIPIKTAYPGYGRCSVHNRQRLSMRTPRLLLAGVAAALVMLAAIPVFGQQFLFSRVDGTWWTTGAAVPLVPKAAGFGDAVGSRTNAYSGNLWWLDAGLNALFRDGVEVGPLVWYNGLLWDVQPTHGFAITDGAGWYAGPDVEDGAVSFLVKIDLLTAQVRPIATLGPSASPVNGLVAIPEPGSMLLVLGALTVLLKRKAEKYDTNDNPIN
jgi:hypothetical protein